MLRYLLFVLCCTSSISIANDFKSVSVYGGLLYNILAEYHTSHPDHNAYAVRLYLQSDATKTIFNDALAMGYSKRRVIKCCYCLSIQADPFVEVISQALCEDMRSYLMWKDTLSWIALGCASFSTISCFGLIFVTGRMYREYLRS